MGVNNLPRIVVRSRALAVIRTRDQELANTRLQDANALPLRLHATLYLSVYAHCADGRRLRSPRPPPPLPPVLLLLLLLVVVVVVVVEVAR